MNEAALFRLSPMTVVTDVEAAALPLLALGGRRAESGDPGCLGVVTARGAALFVTPDFLAVDFGAAVSARLVGRPVLYAHVADAALAADRFGGVRIADALTRGGTREIVCDADDRVVVFAERVVH